MVPVSPDQWDRNSIDLTGWSDLWRRVKVRPGDQLWFWGDDQSRASPQWVDPSFSNVDADRLSAHLRHDFGIEIEFAATSVIHGQDVNGDYWETLEAICKLTPEENRRLFEGFAEYFEQSYSGSLRSWDAWQDWILKEPEAFLDVEIPAGKRYRSGSDGDDGVWIYKDVELGTLYYRYDHDT